MPSSSSCFHLPCPRGAECIAQEKAATEEQKHLRQERVRKQMERQKCGASLTNDDDNEEGSKDDDEDPMAF